MSTAITPPQMSPDAVPNAPQDDAASLLPKKLVRARPLFRSRNRGDARAGRRSSNSIRSRCSRTRSCSWSKLALRSQRCLLLRDVFTGVAGVGFQVQISIWLWFTVLFANFAEAMAEARGKAQADTLRKTKTDVIANRLTASGKIEQVSGSMLRGGGGDSAMSWFAMQGSSFPVTEK